ncbi:hypothetical protein ACP275_04G080500 [Erythranthe tilingii]
MAYRRRQQVGRFDTPFTSNYDSASPPPPPDSSSSSSSASSLATKAIRASSAYRDSSLSSVYEQSALSSPRGATPPSAKDSAIHEEDTPKKYMNESKQSFWGTIARKAKAIIDDDVNTAQPHDKPRGITPMASDRSKNDQYHSAYDSPRSRRDGPALQKGLDAITSSLNYIGGTIGNALEEGFTAVESRTADIIQETKKIQIRKKSGISTRSTSQASNIDSPRHQPMQQSQHMQPQTHTNLETQLKASRDVRLQWQWRLKQNFY